MVRRTALYQSNSAKGAQFREHFSWQIVEHYGNPAEEYQTVVQGVGALDLSDLGKLRVSGRDSARFLHNMVSNDVLGLDAGQGCYAALLTHRGHMESDLYCHALEGEFWLESPAAGAHRVFESLNKHLISEAVTIEERTGDLAVLSFQGPQAREKIEKTLQVDVHGLSPLANRKIDRPGDPWILVRRDRTGCDGYDLWVPVRDAPALWERWLDVEQIAPVGRLALSWLRTEAGIPWYGLDMGNKSLPMEFGLDSAVSMTKGCYRGQEMVSRIAHRGHLDRGLGGLIVDCDEVPQAGAEIRSGDAKAGRITSAIMSPFAGKPLALAVLKKDYLEPGTALDVAYGEESYAAQVVALPLRKKA